MSRKFIKNSWLLLLTAIALITVGCLGGGSSGEPVTHTVTIEIEGEGTVEPAQTHQVTDGATVSFKAEPKAGWRFEKWLVDGDEQTAKEFSRVIKKDLTAKAVFKKITEGPIPIEDPPPVEEPKTFTLTIGQEGEGTVIPDLGEHEFDAATPIQLKAIAAENWEFEKWIVDGTESYDGEMTIVIEEDTTAIAVFKETIEEPKNYTLTIKTEGQGIPTPAAGQHVIQAGEQVELNVSTSDGWKFSKWIITDENGTREENTQRITLTVDGDKEITAVFEKEAPPRDNTRTVTLNVIGEGTVLLQRGFGVGKVVQPGKFQVENREHLTFRTETTGEWKIFSWDIKSPSWNYTSYHNQEYRNLQILNDTEITIVFSNQLNHVYPEAEYILDSLPDQPVSLYARNQTWSEGKIAGPYIPGFEVEIKTFTERGGTSGRERVHDEFRGWVITSRDTGEELPAEQYLADPKAEITTLTMPAEAVTVKAEWIRFLKRFSYENYSTGLRDGEAEITKHYVDLSAMAEGEEFTLEFSAVEYPSRYQIFYGTWDDIITEQTSALVFDTHWVSSHPHVHEDEFDDIRYPDWHDKVYRKNVSRFIQGSGGVFERLIKKRDDHDYVLIIMYNKNGRYSLTKS